MKASLEKEFSSSAYKYKEDMEKGKNGLDMDLMPKIYVLLSSKYLLDKGYTKARFVIRFWNDPGNNDYKEDFDINGISNMGEFFKDKIHRILSINQITFCDREICKVCKSPLRDDFIKQLETLGLVC